MSFHVEKTSFFSKSGYYECCSQALLEKMKIGNQVGKLKITILDSSLERVKTKKTGFILRLVFGGNSIIGFEFH